jgi:hypothetical protein
MSAEQKKEPKLPMSQPAIEEKDEGENQEELNETELEKVAGGVISPRDASSGLATGKRSHKPF